MAYVAPNRGRRNLTVKLGAQVRRIVVENGRATGVEMIDGTRLTATAEVLLASGAIGSPRLLQLSGIGPADHLSELGIDVVFDQPEVGANLQDHLDLYCISELSGPYSYDRYAKPHWAAGGASVPVRAQGAGGLVAVRDRGFWYADPDARSPDIQFHLGLGTGIEHGVVAMPRAGSRSTRATCARARAAACGSRAPIPRKRR
jgi:choline dehydrogenase